MDKFMVLARKGVHQALAFLRDHAWDADLTATFLRVLTHGCAALEADSAPTAEGGVLQLNNSSARGVCLHVCDVFVPELNKVCSEGATALSFERLLTLLEPLTVHATTATDRATVQAAAVGLHDSGAFALCGCVTERISVRGTCAYTRLPQAIRALDALRTLVTLVESDADTAPQLGDRAVLKNPQTLVGEGLVRTLDNHLGELAAKVLSLAAAP